MIIHGNEIMEPEELAQLGAVFDEAWAAVSDTAGEGNAELRTALASIVLQLAHLRQLGPDQIKATALRIFRCEPSQAPSRHPTSYFADEGTSSASAAIAGPPIGA
jgi:hypothetical protein